MLKRTGTVFIIGKKGDAIRISDGLQTILFLRKSVWKLKGATNISDC